MKTEEIIELKGLVLRPGTQVLPLSYPEKI